MTVNNVNALLNLKAAQTAPQTEQAGTKQDETVKASFDKVMTKVNDTLKSLHAGAAGNTSVAASNGTVMNTAQKENVVQNAEQRPVKDAGKTGDAMQREDDAMVQNTAETTEQTEVDAASEEIEQAAGELVQDIAKEMDVTPEEVEEAMAVLGLTAVELFDVANLRQLLLQISGSTDEVSLVTNETLYGNLQNLTTLVEESFVDLQEELGLSEDELNALVEQMISGNEKSDMQAAESVLGQDTPDVNLEGMKDYTVSVQKDGETVQVKVTVDDASGNKSVREEVTDTSKAEVLGERKVQPKDASADSGRGEENAAGHTAGNPFLQTPDKPMETLETQVPVSGSYQSVQTETIMNQIMDYMKINLKADMQQMEMQLHPASLGTVNVQIAAKDGAITAQFTTQNEAVRAVIETQLIQLKEQFEEQGIKVDAVEVTVASHEYGQQFSQDNADTEQKQGKSAKGARRINLDEIDEEGELSEMEESERIAVEMMRASGSTVDYTA